MELLKIMALERRIGYLLIYNLFRAVDIKNHLALSISAIVQQSQRYREQKSLLLKYTWLSVLLKVTQNFCSSDFVYKNGFHSRLTCFNSFLLCYNCLSYNLGLDNIALLDVAFFHLESSKFLFFLCSDINENNVGVVLFR